MNTLGIRLATLRILGKIGDTNTMAENMIILLLALVGMVLLVLPDRLGWTGLPKKFALVLVWVLIAVIFILWIFVFS